MKKEIRDERTEHKRKGEGSGERKILL